MPNLVARLLRVPFRFAERFSRLFTRLIKILLGLFVGALQGVIGEFVGADGSLPLHFVEASNRLGQLLNSSRGIRVLASLL
jgi:hypothetical protein